MKQILTIMTVLLLSMSMISAVTTVPVGVGVNVPISNIAPEVYMDTGSRILLNTFGNPLTRANNYAFEGEQIQWDILVRDVNGISDVNSVTVTVGDYGEGQPAEAGCSFATQPTNGDDMSAFGGGAGTFDSTTDRVYTCLFTVETSASMAGQSWIKAEVDDGTDLTAVTEESFFFMNPTIQLRIENADNGIEFPSVIPGGVGYSQTILVRNNAQQGSGVILDLDISGTDFYDPTSSGALCPTSNQLELSAFRYFATKGSYDTSGSPTADAEGYDEIDYNWDNMIRGAGVQASQFTEGAEFAVTFKLSLPSPCIGDFTQGEILFEGTAI